MPPLSLLFIVAVAALTPAVTAFPHRATSVAAWRRPGKLKRFVLVAACISAALVSLMWVRSYYFVDGMSVVFLRGDASRREKVSWRVSLSHGIAEFERINETTLLPSKTWMTPYSGPPIEFYFRSHPVRNHKFSIFGPRPPPPLLPNCKRIVFSKSPGQRTESLRLNLPHWIPLLLCCMVPLFRLNEVRRAKQWYFRSPWFVRAWQARFVRYRATSPTLLRFAGMALFWLIALWLPAWVCLLGGTGLSGAHSFGASAPQFITAVMTISLLAFVVSAWFVSRCLPDDHWSVLPASIVGVVDSVITCPIAIVQLLILWVRYAH